ncbi:hypothetical protein E4U55_003542 [Claviceps digitariae]|nr:hypothetical protein E4U55_003542 [Claviceps digitariae]
MSGGNDGIPAPGVVGDDSRLGQLTDAVAMENMSSTTAVTADTTEPKPAPASHEATKPVALEPPSTTLPDSDVHADADRATTTTTTNTNTNTNTLNIRDEAAATDAPSKGKEKEEDVAPRPTKERSNSILAIGPAHDDITVAPAHSEGPVCNITLLLTSGSRHPYKIDAKYLSRRNVAIPDETEAGQPDPFSISIYTLKELILREWRNDWEAKPASPSSIRLIHFGKLLDDKEQLKKYQFSTETPNVVHMSIRPQDLDEEEPKSGSKSLPSGRGDGPRSRANGICCAIL